MELDTDRLKGNECITKPTILSGRQNKKGYKTMSARFLNSPRYRDSLTNIVWDENACIAYDEIAKEDHSYVAILTLRQEEKEAEMRNHCIRETTTKKQRRLATSCARSMQQLQNVVTQELFILKNTFDKDPTKNSRGTERIRIGLIQKLGGSIIFLQQ